MASLDKKPRLKNPIRKKPYFETIAPGISLGYRRNQGAGAWMVRAADGKGGNWTKGFAVADDFEASNQKSVLNYEEAQNEARKLARAGGVSASSGHDTGRPLLVGDAIDIYETDLMMRGGNKNNACQLRIHLSPRLARKPVSMLVDSDLRNWRNDLITVAGLKVASANRHAKSMKAALTLAARGDKRITNNSEWRNGLSKLPDDNNARNVILEDDVVLAVVSTAYDIKHLLGVWCQTLSETGNRESQIKRCEVKDLQTDRVNPRLLVPSSFKGKNRKITRKPLPITVELANHLMKFAAGKKPGERLLPKLGVELSKQFRPVVERLKLDSDVTPYSLRHSSVVRMLLKGIPTRLVASVHDTSVVEIERTYSHYIVSDTTESILRGSLLTTPKLKLVA
jgi:integrase